MPELQNVELSELQESKTNPRQNFDKAFMAELVASVKQSGIITPLIVRSIKNGADLAGHLEIVDGAQRFRAAKLANLPSVPVLVRQLADSEAIELQVIANDQRMDVHPIEQCAGYERLLKEANLTLEGLAQRVGKSQAYVAKRMAYANLIDPIRKLFLEYKISPVHANLAARLTAEQQKASLPWLKRGDSASGYADEIERAFFLTLKGAAFDPADAKLVPKAGTCLACPKRTGTNRLLFDDIKEQDVCTDPVCFENKTKAFIKIQVGTHPDAILLSRAGSYQTTKFQKDWVKAGNTKCADTKEGVLVEVLSRYDSYDDDDDNQKAKLGQVLSVCVNPKCKIHNPNAGRSGSTYHRPESELKAEKARKVELRRRGLIFKELAADSFDVKKVDYRTMLDHNVRRLSSDDARAVCNAMEWDAGTSHGGKDYHGTIKKQLADLTEDGVERWLYLISLAAIDLWFYNHTKISKPELLEAKAKAAGVELSQIAKLAEKTKKQRDKRLAAETAKAKPAKKAKASA